MIYLSRLLLDPYSRRVQTELATPYEMHRTLCHAFPNLSPDEWKAARVLFRVDDDNERLSLLVQSHRAPDWEAFAAHLGDKRYLLGAPAVKKWEPRFEDGQQLRFRLQANPTYSPIIAGAVNKKGRFKSKPVGLYREAERLDWLRRQSEQHGFTLPLVETKLLAQRDERGNRTPIPFRGGVNEDQWTLDLPACEIVDLNSGPLQDNKGQIQPHAQTTQRPRRAPMPLESVGKETPRIVRFGSAEFSAARFDGTLAVADVEAFAHAVENGVGKARGFGFGLLSVAPVTK